MSKDWREGMDSWRSILLSFGIMTGYLLLGRLITIPFTPYKNEIFLGFGYLTTVTLSFLVTRNIGSRIGAWVIPMVLLVDTWDDFRFPINLILCSGYLLLAFIGEYSSKWLLHRQAEK
jgi:hypothetical protein